MMENSNQIHDYENGTVESFASVAGSTINDVDLEGADDDVHDQLPSVEEYKANMPSISPSKSDAIQESPYRNASSDDVANFDDSASYVQDQLPTVDEIKAMSGTGDGGWGWLHYFAIFVGLVVLTVVIVVPTVTSQAKESSQKTTVQSPGSAPVASTPTIPPMERKENIVQYLSNAGVSTTSQLTTSGTPQYKAVDWLTMDDELYMPVPDNDYKYTRFIERYVLTVLYFSTNGPAWTFQMNFLTGVDHCNWRQEFLLNFETLIQFGVSECTNVEESNETGGGQMTTKLLLPSNGLHGRLPSELQFLHRLQVLHVPQNQKLKGNLDFGLQHLQYLELLALQYCELSGAIPSEIGTLSKLTYLGLGNNELSGELPTTFFQLSNLEFLGLDDNLLQGNIALFGQLSNLKYAYLEDNQFTGELTDTLTKSWSVTMEELDLSRNLINSTIPASMFAMTNLAILDLHANHLRGSLPEITNRNGALQLLALHDNDLTGQIPTTISNLATLRHLDVAKNMLISPIPGSIGLLSNLEYLFMGGNDFSSHPVPMFLWALTGLKELSMKNNSITGTIPAAIGSLTRLQLIDFDANRLTGTIPNEMGLLTGLDYLLLNRNSLSGTIPSTFTLLYDLNVLLLDHNKINGTADVICNDTNIALQYFVADCEGPNVNIQCSCCNLCCNDLNATCNNLGWHVNIDPLWEQDFMRSAYDFSKEIIAVEP